MFFIVCVLYFKESTLTTVYGHCNHKLCMQVVWQINSPRVRQIMQSNPYPHIQFAVDFYYCSERAKRVS